MSRDMQPVDLREIIFNRPVDQIVRQLGSRAVAELLRKLGQKHMIRTSIEAEVKEFVSRLSPEMLRVTGANRLPPTPLHLPRGDT